MNTTRYVSLMSQVVDANMPPPSINIKDEDLSTFDVIMQQRKANLSQAQQRQATNAGLMGSGQGMDPKQMLPPELERQY